MAIALATKIAFVAVMDYSGKWALITGASAGIGETFAKHYAGLGANIALTARRGDRLQALADTLREDHGVETCIITADLSNPGAPREIAAALQAKGVSPDILVNNAGFGMPGFFVASDWTAHRDFIELMVTSYAHLTRLFLPAMLERDYGRIINVASLAGLTPGAAGHTLYGASKAFLVGFSQSLSAECDQTGVNVTALCPGFTYSEFHDVNGAREIVSQLPGYMFMQAGPVVSGAVKAVERGKVVHVPGLWNKFVAWLARALPRSWAQALAKGQSKRFRRQSAD